MNDRILYKLDEAAEKVSVSMSTIRRAMAATDPNANIPPLKVKNLGTDRKPSYRVQHAVLEAWADSLKDA